MGKRNALKYCTSAVKQCAKLMVWGAFSGKAGCGWIWFMEQGTTINSTIYKSILEEKMLRFRQIQDVEYFQHDGAPCHMAKTVKKWLADQNVLMIGPWPGSSPDLNPIENLWIQMKRKVAAHNPSSLQHFKEIVKKVWVTETSLDDCKAYAAPYCSRAGS